MTVTFFGHKDTPIEIEPTLRTTLIDLIENHGATEFYVGNNGSFDIMVHRQLKDLSRNYPVTYSTVLSYIPGKRNKCDDYTNTLIPEGIEAIPKRFAISYRNRWMLRQADVVVTYVTHTFGGARQFKTLADKQGKSVIEMS